MNGKYIDEINVGDYEVFQKTVSESDVYLYAGITGDFNPVHVNDVKAKKSMFNGRIAHGMLTAGFISTVLGTLLPGPGTIYRDQTLSFKKPVYFGDTITAKVTVIEIIIEKNIIHCETVCFNQNDEVVVTGIAKVMPPKKMES